MKKILLIVSWATVILSALKFFMGEVEREGLLPEKETKDEKKDE